MTTTPNPALVAAAPVLLNVITELQAFFNTVLTGDPSQIALRFDGASKVLLGQIELQLPVLATDEINVLETDLNTKLNSWKSGLSALSAGTPAAK